MLEPFEDFCMHLLCSCSELKGAWLFRLKITSWLQVEIFSLVKTLLGIGKRRKLKFKSFLPMMHQRIKMMNTKINFHYLIWTAHNLTLVHHQTQVHRHQSSHPMKMRSLIGEKMTTNLKWRWCKDISEWFRFVTSFFGHSNL